MLEAELARRSASLPSLSLRACAERELRRPPMTAAVKGFFRFNPRGSARQPARAVDAATREDELASPGFLLTRLLNFEEQRMVEFHMILPSPLTVPRKDPLCWSTE